MRWLVYPQRNDARKVVGAVLGPFVDVGFSLVFLFGPEILAWGSAVGRLVKGDRINPEG